MSFFKRFKEKGNFIKTIKEFAVSKSAMIFKIIIVKLLDKSPRLKNSLLLLHFMKSYFKTIEKYVRWKPANLNS